MSYPTKSILAFTLLLILTVARITLVLNTPSVNAQPTQQSLMEGQVIFQDIGRISYGQTAQPQDVRITVVRIINVVLGFLAIIFLLLVVIAGIKYMLSAGNQEKVKQALGLIKNAIIGLIIAVFSWSISFFILLRLRAITRGDVNYINPPETIF